VLIALVTREWKEGGWCVDGQEKDGGGGTEQDLKNVRNKIPPPNPYSICRASETPETGIVATACDTRQDSAVAARE
jgi:hypothetical protein